MYKKTTKAEHRKSIKTPAASHYYAVNIKLSTSSEM